MELPAITLEDKYLIERGRIFLSGRQALVRLPMLQRQLDRAQGLHTAGFISGYRGSPLGSYDSELMKAHELLQRQDILFQPGLNEDLALTAVLGTQQIGFLPGRKVDGVFALWYGKGPGVDRAGDALRHANRQGTEALGGVLLVCGDDHAGKSSTVAHQSDLALAAHDIPVLYPATTGEIIEYGLAGFALSRYSGLLVGLKIVNETAETTSVMPIDIDTLRFDDPDLPGPPGGVSIRKEFLAVQDQEVRLLQHRIPRAHAFARLNRLDGIVFGAARPRFLIVTAGKAYADVVDGLDLLGIDEPTAQRIGLGVYKVGMIFPLEPLTLRAAAAHADELLFIEEKRAHVETQAASALFNTERHPRFSGKHDPDGRPLLPSDRTLESTTVALAIETRLRAGLDDLATEVPWVAKRAAVLLERSKRMVAPSPLRRPPSFCAGCPHNTSTTVPDASAAMTGIGCHGMAIFLPERNPLPPSHMGGEGAAWLGLGPYTGTPHVFQNLGDGTYNHSGSLAIRAAVQAKANITYKILYNDAVAMTGGQPVEGGLTVEQIARQMLAENVARVVVVSDRPERFADETLPPGIPAFDRSELDAIQRTLRDTPGVTVLIYDQTCAAEKRRRRKRAHSMERSRRAFINHRVCEGCGDCSVQSNCLAIAPLESALGRKRVVDQSSCNEDLSCVRGFCPSFVTLDGAALKRPRPDTPIAALRDLPDPPIPSLTEPFDILVTGVGGTGVVTIGAIVGMAAHLEGRGASIYDMTGLSQKGGAVFSHVRLFPQAGMWTAARVGRGQADLILACDAVAALLPEATQAIEPGETQVIVNEGIVAPAEFSRHPDLSLDVEQLRDSLAAAAGSEPATLDARELALTHLGDAIATNMIMLGYAWQSGRVPLTRAAVEQAIRLNGTAVSFNLRAFALGRAAAAGALPRTVPPDSKSLDEYVRERAENLTAYWNEEYAQRYIAIVQQAREREAVIGAGSETFSWAAARSLFRLMAYKDEYEVARLYADGDFQSELDRQFERGYRLKFHLAPPLLSWWKDALGRPRKIALGSWAMTMFKVLAHLKHLRETPFDVFGRSRDRKLERRLRDEHLQLIRELIDALTPANHAHATALAAAPEKVRGFGPVKHRSFALFEAEKERMLLAFRAVPKPGSR